MPRTRIALFAALAVLVLVMAGCSKQDPPFTAEDQIPESMVEPAEGEGGEGEGEGGEPVGTAEFVAVDIEFTEAPETIPAGTVAFELINEGAAPHDVTIEETDQTVVKANGGETASGNTTLEPGSYTYYCSVPGHRGAGMEGTFTVE